MLQATLDDHDPAGWEDLWRVDTRASVYHHPSWTRALLRAHPHFRSIPIAVRDEERLVGLLPLIEARRLGTRQLFSLPFGTYGGPLLAPGGGPEVVETLAAAFGKLAEGTRSVAAEMVLFEPDPEAARPFQDLSWEERSEETTDVIDLTDGFDPLWNGRYDRNTRNCVRMAERAGVTVSVEDGPAALDALWALYQEQTQAWSRDTVHPRETIEAVIAELGDRARIHLARHAGDPVMACLFLEDGRREIHPWVSGGNAEARRLRASHFLYDRALRDACARGLAAWHFGGSLGNPKIEFFKRSFGAAPRPVLRLHQRAGWFRRGLGGFAPVSRIRTNTLAVGASFFTTAVLGFAQTKILTNYLSRDAVGILSAVLAVGALLATASELGMPLVLVRYGAKYDAEGRLGRLARLLRFVHRTYLSAVVVMVGILLVAGPGLAALLGEGSESVDRRLIVLGYLAVAAASLRAFNNASFRGVRKMTAIPFLETGFAILVTGGYFLLRNQLSVPLVLTLFMGSSVIIALAGFVRLRSLLRPVAQQGDPATLSDPIFPEIRSYWQGAAGGGLLLIAVEQLDKPILTQFVSFEEIAVFYVAARLGLFARRLLYEPFRVMNPEITHKWEGPRRHELRRDLELFVKLELGLGLALTVFLSVFAKTLLVLISNREFLSGAPVLWAYAAMIPLLCFHQPLNMFLRAVGHVWLAVLSDALWLVTYLAVGSALLLRLGLPGFVLGQVTASALVIVYVLAIFHRRGLPRPEIGFFAGRIALSAAVWAFSVYLGHALPVLSWWTALALGGALLVVGNVLLVRGGFLRRDEEERTLDLLAGRGPAGRVARFVLGWPRGSFRGS